MLSLKPETDQKVLSYDEAPAVMDRLRAEGKRIVQCHGTFDLVHPGHIFHLEEARAQGDVLVVTVTAEKFVNKGPGRPYFNDTIRAKTLSKLECVDYIVMIPFAAAVEAIECIKPHIYCKGKEYENPSNDVMNNIGDDVLTVQRHGGEMRYLGSVVFSSSKLLNNFFDTMPGSLKGFCKNLAADYPPEQFRTMVERMQDMKILVVGDIIFDRYSYVRVQGLTSKNRILSGRFLKEQTQAGGALAVYRHIKQLCEGVDLLGLIGRDPVSEAMLKEHLPDEDDQVLRQDGFITVIKQRFVEPLSEGKELSKLFSVNYINGDHVPELQVEQTLERLEKLIDQYDMICVTDFGHGLMQDAVRAFVQDRAQFMALNCQTNSNNHGFNIITRQYHRADCFSLDEQELLLSCGKRNVAFGEHLKDMQAHFAAAQAWLTRGATETIACARNGNTCQLIPLEQNVTDTIGAGDAFFALASMAACKGYPIELSTFMGQLAGAQAVRIVGNEKPISKSTLIKSGMTLLQI